MPSVSVVRLGCARNDADSDELAGRLLAAGWQVVEEPADADAVVVNTCGFIEAAKQESVQALLDAADGTRPVVAVGCLAERYGDQLAGSMPEVQAVLGFDHYPAIAERLTDVLSGRPVPAHRPRDRRRLLPVTPVGRAATPPSPHPAAPPSGPRPVRARLGNAPTAPLKLATGCDRRCSFCAIPSFRGRFVSRPPDEVLEEARWLAAAGVRELYLVSENSTSYGKDLGEVRALERLLPQLAAVEGVARVRVSYLQPAELRPGLLEVIAATPGVAPYFDLSFQHASATVLRRMRRFGDGDRFLGLLDHVRRLAPNAGVRSNFIVGFPGERRPDVAELVRFVERARLDAAGVFAFSPEDGTEAATLDRPVRKDVAQRRLRALAALLDELMAQRAEERVGEEVEVLVESVDAAGAEGRAAHQGPDVDGTTCLPAGDLRVGDLVRARVTGSNGVDLLAHPVSAGVTG